MNLIETYNGSGFYAQYATSADYASNGTPLSAALTAIPDTYLQNTDLTIANNKVTEISGIPLAGGGGSAYIGWGYDDSITELWTGHATPLTTVTLSESINNFRYILMRGNSGISDRTPWVVKVDTEAVRIMSAINTKMSVIVPSLHPTSTGEQNYALITLNLTNATITPGYYTKAGTIAADSNQSLDGISGYSRIV